MRWCWANDTANASKATVARNTSWIVRSLLLFRLPSEIFVRFSPFLIILSRSFVADYNQVNDDSQFQLFLIRCFFFWHGYVGHKLALRIQINYNIYFVCFVQVLFLFSLTQRNKICELKFRLKFLLVLALGRSLNPSSPSPQLPGGRVKIQSLYPCPAPQSCHLLYRAYSRTWPASMQIYGNKRNLHKKRVQLPQHLFGTPIWLPWSHVNTLYGVPWDLWRHSKWPPSCSAKKFWFSLAWKKPTRSSLKV